MSGENKNGERVKKERELELKQQIKFNTMKANSIVV